MEALARTFTTPFSFKSMANTQNLKRPWNPEEPILEVPARCCTLGHGYQQPHCSSQGRKVSPCMCKARGMLRAHCPLVHCRPAAVPDRSGLLLACNPALQITFPKFPCFNTKPKPSVIVSEQKWAMPLTNPKQQLCISISLLRPIGHI